MYKKIAQIVSSQRDVHDETSELGSDRIQHTEHKNDKARNGVGRSTDDESTMALNMLGFDIGGHDGKAAVKNKDVALPWPMDGVFQVVTLSASSPPSPGEGYGVVRSGHEVIKIGKPATDLSYKGISKELSNSEVRTLASNEAPFSIEKVGTVGGQLIQEPLRKGGQPFGVLRDDRCSLEVLTGMVNEPHGGISRVSARVNVRHDVREVAGQGEALNQTLHLFFDGFNRLANAIDA